MATPTVSRHGYACHELPNSTKILHHGLLCVTQIMTQSWLEHVCFTQGIPLILPHGMVEQPHAADFAKSIALQCMAIDAKHNEDLRSGMRNAVCNCGRSLTINPIPESSLV